MSKGIAPSMSSPRYLRLGRVPGCCGPGRAVLLCWLVAASWWVCLLRVELDDQLLLDRGVDHLAGREGVDQDAHLAGDDLHPRRRRAVARGLTGDDVRRELAALRPDLDDVVRRHAVRRDVDLLAVDQHVAVADRLAGVIA